jgi:hypothetical protein
MRVISLIKEIMKEKVKKNKMKGQEKKRGNEEKGMMKSISNRTLKVR